jgi:hypothetical protein
VGLDPVGRTKKGKFLEQLGTELEEATARKAGRKLVLIDANYCEEEEDHERRQGPWRAGSTWREEQGLVDTWRVRHADREGFTREQDGQGSTRIDYVWLEDEGEAAVSDAWVGPREGEIAGIASDHRPLIVQLDAVMWIGEDNPVKEPVRVTPDPVFVPRHWVASTEEEYEEAVKVAKELNRKPTLVRWKDVQEAQQAVEVMGSHCFIKKVHVSPGEGHGGLLTERPATRRRVTPGSRDNEIPHSSSSCRSCVFRLVRPRRWVGWCVIGRARRRGRWSAALGWRFPLGLRGRRG